MEESLHDRLMPGRSPSTRWVLGMNGRAHVYHATAILDLDTLRTRMVLATICAECQILRPQTVEPDGSTPLVTVAWINSAR